jgi:hypothetical protein
MRTIIRIAIAIAIALASSLTTPLLAQRNEVTLEASVVRGALGYARHASPKVLFGFEVGFGFPQFDRTLSPKQDPDTGSPDFEEYLHIAPFVRFKANHNFEIDAGLRASIADLWPCDASDCLPAIFAGAYVQPMVGWRRIKVGARLTAGEIWEGEPDSRTGQGDKSTRVVGLAPFLVRATFPF